MDLIYDPTTLGQASVTDPNGNATSETYDADGNVVSKTNGLGRTWTYTYNSFDEQTCAASPQAPSPCSALSPPTAVTVGSSTITPPSSAPPAYVTYTEYDTNGNKIWTTTGAYAPGASTASDARTTYDLYAGESVTLGGTTDSCDAVPPSSALPCATIDAKGTVTQLDYDSDGDLSSSATPDDNASTISTFAGGVMGPVLGTDIAQSPGSVTTVTVGGTKYAYVTDEWNDVIRRINLSSDEEQVVAGNYAWATCRVSAARRRALSCADPSATGRQLGRPRDRRQLRQHDRLRPRYLGNPLRPGHDGRGHLHHRRRRHRRLLGR